MKLFDLINPLKIAASFTSHFGGGGSSSGTPYYANQDKLFGAQADIATNLYNQYAGLAPGYLQNSLNMTNDAMDGTLSKQMREQAGNNATSTMGAALGANDRNMQRYGMGMSTNRIMSENNRNAIMGAGMKAGEMNNANTAAEDAKWNRNANAYGQISGMSSGAMQGMSSAASGYGSMANSISSNNAANAAGMGKFGASIGTGMFKADGGYIEKRGLHLANGGSAQRVTAPQGYVQHVSDMSPVDWRSYATNGNYSRGGVNPLAAIGGGIAARAAMEAAGSGLKGSGNQATEWLKGQYNAATAPSAREFTVDQTLDPSYVNRDSMMYNSAYNDGANTDSIMYESGSQAADPSLWSTDPAYASGGYIQHFATGGYAQPIQESYGLSDPYTNRREGPSDFEQAGNMAGNAGLSYGTREGMKGAYNYATTPNPTTSFVTSDAATPGVSSTAPVADSGAGVTSTALPETASAAGAGETAAGATAATGAGETAAGTAAATTGAEAAGAAAAGSAAAEAAAAAAAAEAAGTVAAGEGLSEAALLLLLKDGGQVPQRGLKRKNMKPGGKVAGPGTETSDDIPAWLSDGEFVLNAEAVKLIGKDKLEALNNHGLKMRGQAPKASAKKTGGTGLKLATGGAALQQVTLGTGAGSGPTGGDGSGHDITNKTDDATRRGPGADILYVAGQDGYNNGEMSQSQQMTSHAGDPLGTYVAGALGLKNGGAVGLPRRNKGRTGTKGRK